MSPVLLNVILRREVAELTTGGLYPQGQGLPDSLDAGPSGRGKRGWTNTPNDPALG